MIGFARWWFFAIVVLSQTSSPPPKVIDRAVASVEGRVITLSELEFEARLALIQAGGTRGADAALDEEALRSALRLSIAERLEVSEADKLQAFQIDDEEVEASYRAFRDRFSSTTAFNEFLARHEADVPQVKALLARRLRTEKILDSKTRLRVRISEGEVRQYFDQHRGVWKDNFDQVRDQIREKLFRERYTSLVSEEFNQIMQSADVRLIAPFARASPKAAR